MHRMVYMALLLALGFGGCRPGVSANPKVDYHQLTAFEGEALRMVVEIPAGTNHKYEFDHQTAEFTLDTLADGSQRVINFLPYPGNYGFIPGTLMDRSRGGDGDPLDVLVIAETQPTGTVMLVKPLGALLLRDRGEIDTKIIAIPADSSLQVLRAHDFIDFMLHHDPARQLIEQWFLYYKGPGQTELIRWEDDQFARQEVQRWLTSK